MRKFMNEATPPVKTCTKCGTPKPLDQFSHDKNRLDGRRYWCSQCFRDYSKAHPKTSGPKKRGPKPQPKPVTHKSCAVVERRSALTGSVVYGYQLGTRDPVLGFEDEQSVLDELMVIRERVEYENELPQVWDKVEQPDLDDPDAPCGSDNFEIETEEVEVEL